VWYCIPLQTAKSNKDAVSEITKYSAEITFSIVKHAEGIALSEVNADFERDALKLKQWDFLIIASSPLWYADTPAFRVLEEIEQYALKFQMKSAAWRFIWASKHKDEVEQFKIRLQERLGLFGVGDFHFPVNF
jgi:hypothetical protein